MRACFVALTVLFLSLPAADAAASPAVTIIIDDLGYTLGAGERAVGLPGPVVCAVLPQTPRARRLAELAHANDKEVLVHLPLQPVGYEGAAAPGSLLLDMTRQRFGSTLLRNLQSVPHAIGINGHQGSMLTRHPGHMQWLMDEIGSRGLIFVDSYTTHLSVALRLANENGIRATRRDVFLDSDPQPAAIRHEFERLLRLAEEQGSAVAIGHPYPTTFEFLERAIPALPARGFRLVGIRELIDAQRDGGRPGRALSAGKAARGASP